MKDSLAKRLLLYNLDPKPVHRQNLIFLGFPAPQLPINQLGPTTDTTTPMAMSVEEQVG